MGSIYKIELAEKKKLRRHFLSAAGVLIISTIDYQSWMT